MGVAGLFYNLPPTHACHDARPKRRNQLHLPLGHALLSGQGAERSGQSAAHLITAAAAPAVSAASSVYATHAAA